jgi:predicted ATP-dependent protease
MLDEEVVSAVKQGKFHIYPVSSIEEGIEILTGVPAGELQEDGTFSPGTIFCHVDERLEQIYQTLKEEKKNEED